MRAILHEQAEAELQDAARWYNRRVVGLGEQFLSAAIDAFIEIEKHPGRFPLDPLSTDEHELHRYRLDRFPYSLIYRRRKDQLLIVAISHTAREPGYWRDRI
jgi:toxin ParE1/3/4